MGTWTPLGCNLGARYTSESSTKSVSDLLRVVGMGGPKCTAILELIEYDLGKNSLSFSLYNPYFIYFRMVIGVHICFKEKLGRVGRWFYNMEHGVVDSQFWRCRVAFDVGCKRPRVYQEDTVQRSES